MKPLVPVRCVPLLALILVTGMPLPSEGSRPERVVVQLPWKHQFQFAGFYAAAAEGYYAEAGLEVELREISPGVVPVDEVVARRAQFGVARSEVLLERLAGRPLVALAVLFQHSPAVVLTRADSGIRSPQGLAGRTVELGTPGVNAEVFAMLLGEGVDPGRILVKEPTFDLSDLIQGRTDAVSAYSTSQPFELHEKGIGFHLIRPITYGVDFYGDCLFTSERELREHGNRVRAFRDATLRGWKYTFEHTDDVIDLILNSYDTRGKLSREFLEFEAAEIRRLVVPDLVEIGHMNPGRWERMADTFARLGMMEPDHDLDGFLYEPEGGRFDWTHWSLKLLGVIILLLVIVIPLLYSRKVKREIDRRRRAREEYTGILHSAMDGFWLLDGAGRILDVNEAYCRMSGHSRDELLGMQVSDLEAVESDEEVRAHIREVREKGEHRFESRHRRRNGEIIDVEASATYLRGEAGEGTFFVFVRDITERKRAEQATDESHVRLLTILDSIDAAIYVADLETYEILFMNRNMRDSFGGDLVGNLCYEVFRGEPGPCAHCTNDRLLDPGGNPAGVVVWEGKNPITGKWYINYDRAIPWVDGRIVRLQVATDITEHKRADEALRESEAQKELILNATVETVQYYDTELRVIWVNRASAASVGASPGELVGRYCYEIWYRRSEPCTGCHVLRARDTGEPKHAETRTPDGRCWLMRAYPVLDEQGRVTAMVEFGWDVTEQRRAEEEKKRLEEQVHQAQRLESLGRLAGGVAHDLNNLLTPILGYGELLLEDVAEADPRRKPLEEILNAGRRARDLVHRLLAFSRRQVLEFRPVDLNVLLTRFYKLLRRTIREDIAIRLDLDRSLPPVRGDPGQLEQVVMNLAVNAQDAMPEGGELLIGTARSDQDGRGGGGGEEPAHGSVVVLTVRDTGCGMDEAARRHLFEPFFTTKGKERGTGLGLSIVYGIVRQHGGSIGVSSEPGSGTTFRIFLPSIPDPPGLPGMPPGEHTEGSPDGLRGTETVVLVEDNEQVRNLTCAMLAQQGYTMLTAAGGREALDMLEHRDGPVDLLLADVIMPGMNGRQLYGQVSVLYPGIKVLYMSGYTHDVIARHGMMEPGVNFIQKPFSSRTLAAKVREVLDR